MDYFYNFKLQPMNSIHKILTLAFLAVFFSIGSAGDIFAQSAQLDTIKNPGVYKTIKSLLKKQKVTQFNEKEDQKGGSSSDSEYGIGNVTGKKKKSGKVYKKTSKGIRIKFRVGKDKVIAYSVNIEKGHFNIIKELNPDE